MESHFNVFLNISSFICDFWLCWMIIYFSSCYYSYLCIYGIFKMADGVKDKR